MNSRQREPVGLGGTLNPVPMVHDREIQLFLHIPLFMKIWRKAHRPALFPGIHQLIQNTPFFPSPFLQTKTKLYNPRKNPNRPISPRTIIPTHKRHIHIETIQIASHRPLVNQSHVNILPDEDPEGRLTDSARGGRVEERLQID